MPPPPPPPRPYPHLPTELWITILSHAPYPTLLLISPTSRQIHHATLKTLDSPHHDLPHLIHRLLLSLPTTPPAQTSTQLARLLRAAPISVVPEMLDVVRELAVMGAPMGRYMRMVAVFCPGWWKLRKGDDEGGKGEAERAFWEPVRAVELARQRLAFSALDQLRVWISGEEDEVGTLDCGHRRQRVVALVVEMHRSGWVPARVVHEFIKELLVRGVRDDRFLMCACEMLALCGREFDRVDARLHTPYYRRLEKIVDAGRCGEAAVERVKSGRFVLTFVRVPGPPPIEEEQVAGHRLAASASSFVYIPAGLLPAEPAFLLHHMSSLSQGKPDCPVAIRSAAYRLRGSCFEKSERWTCVCSAPRRSTPFPTPQQPRSRLHNLHLL
ncbi:hypothetical protein BDK51DRAFT_41591 [Blyttiomyces helicus]|uniref:F-box domain-containing protein n=1 Tax=Blyttiomyces helicus TaxID=388810 RepID=A0A4P9WA79_9FUNG|nr:hypothetical protein BDK51DRAFT_41591 [Blyttiomyces helicus]|eukprot:RKO87750.1 hypothetical protein BDK51DRAFT_41591 [Blyttiomyces helicus]